MTSQTAVAPQGQTGSTPPSNPILSFVPMIVVVLIMYMLIIRPQQKQAKELRGMLDALKNGDKVVTQGGLIGIVASLKGTVVSLKIADNVKVDVTRSSISQIIKETPVTGGAPVPTLEVK